jgi:hypothetical protein
LEMFRGRFEGHATVESWWVELSLCTSF